MVSVSGAYAHPDTMFVKINGENGPMNVKIIGLETLIKDDTKETEFLSNVWFWENFILLLSGGIVLVMAITIPLVYREELNINKN